MKKGKKMTSAQVAKVIANFEKVLPLANGRGHLNMMCSFVKNRDHKCGTVHCHAGWYAVAVLDHEKRKFLDYSDGASAMAKDLGFGSREELQSFAEKNPSVWGNKNGYSMFHLKAAFVSRKRQNGATKLSHIVDHWKEVHARLLKMENREIPAP